MDMDDLREIGQSSSRNKTSSKGANILIWAFTGISCFGFLIVSGFFAMSYLNSPSVQTTAGVTSQSTKIRKHGSGNLYAKLQTRCIKRINRTKIGTLDIAAFQRHFDRVGQMAGQRSMLQQSFLKCMLSGTNSRLCSSDFKTSLVLEIKKYIGSGSKGRLLAATSGAFGNSKHKEALSRITAKQRKNFRKSDPIILEVKRLFHSGHLKSGDFSTFWGTPDWAEQFEENEYKGKNPCS